MPIPLARETLWRWLGSCCLVAALSIALPGFAEATVVSAIRVRWESEPASQIKSRVESLADAEIGAIFSERSVKSLLERILGLLASTGHHHAVLQPRDFMGNADTVSYAVTIDAGPLSYIRRWDLAGLRRTDANWLSQSLRLPLGVIADDDAVAAAVHQIEILELVKIKSPPVIQSIDDSSVVVVLSLEDRAPARLEGALAAGAGEPTQRSLLGRFSLGLSGLFRRGHSVNVQYEQPRTSERLLRLDYGEKFSVMSRLHSRVEFEDWRRSEHRQSVGSSLKYLLSRAQNANLLLGARWQKLAPLQSGIKPARQYDMSIGFEWNPARNAGFALWATYSTYREWSVVGDQPLTLVRARFDGSARFGVGLIKQTTAQLSVGTRWWGDRSATRPGDEWFLGGDMLSGYQTRAIEALQGAWTRFELHRMSTIGLGAALFGDLAWLTLFDGDVARPRSAGCALIIESAERMGRLELAWRDGARFRDGIIRLSMIQGW